MALPEEGLFLEVVEASSSVREEEEMGVRNGITKQRWVPRL